MTTDLSFFDEVSEISPISIDEVLHDVVKRPVQLAEEAQLCVSDRLDKGVLYEGKIEPVWTW